MKITIHRLAKAIALTDKESFTNKLINVTWYDVPFYKKLEYLDKAQKVIEALKWLKKNEEIKDEN